MKQKIYAVWDKIALEFGPPFCAKNDDVAKRQYNHLVRTQQLSISEFELWTLGTYDTERGIDKSYTNLVIAFNDDVVIEGGDTDGTAI